MLQLKTTIINGKSFFLFISAYLILGTLLTMWVAWKLHFFAIVWAGIFIFWVCPFLFQRLFRANFTRSVILSFSENLLIIGVVNKKSNNLEETREIKFSDIQSFRAIDS